MYYLTRTLTLLFLGLFLIQSTSWSLAPVSSVQEDSKELRQFAEALDMDPELPFYRFAKFSFPDFLKFHFKGEIELLIPFDWKNNPVIVIYREQLPGQVQLLPEWVFPIRLTGILKDSKFSRPFFFQVLDPPEVLSNHIWQLNSPQDPIHQILLSFGLNPKLSSFFGHSPVTERHDGDDYLSNANSRELRNAVAQLFPPDEKGLYADLPDKKYPYIYIQGNGERLPTHLYFFHELMHQVFFSSYTGRERRKDFRLSVLKLESTIRDLFYMREERINFIFESIKGTASNMGDDPKERFVQSEMALSEMFTLLAGVYYDIEEQTKGISKRESPGFDAYETKVSALPKPLHDFFDKLKLISPNPTPRPVFHSFAEILTVSQSLFIEASI